MRIRCLVSALLVVAGAAAAQQPAKVYRIGYLSAGSATTTYTRPAEALRQGLRELGWVDGRNLAIEYRYAEGHADRLPALAEELVRLKVDVIVASPTPSALAAKSATRTIPVVGLGLAQPVAVGRVESLARPGGNVTGLTYGADTDIAGKQLQLLKEVVPGVRRVAVLYNPAGSPVTPLILESIRNAARSLDLPLVMLEARGPAHFDAAFAAMVRERAGALLLTGDSMFFVHRARLAELAAKHRLPSMSTQWQWVEAGGLVSYGPSLTHEWRRGATYVDKILRGARPADLPIEEPTKFEFVVNLRTARALGVVLPPAVLRRADEVLD